MSEVADAAAPSAGRLLREARERQGLHIAVLAASIKVTPKKLELLEADRFDALPDATFTRALAQTVCRALKLDPAAVLVLLPPPAGHRLEHVSEGLNAPFRERPGVLGQRDNARPTLGPVFWVTVAILAASLGLYLLPSGWLANVGWPGHGATSNRRGRATREHGAERFGVAAAPTLVAPVSTEPPTVAAPEPEPAPPGAEPSAALGRRAPLPASAESRSVPGYERNPHWCRRAGAAVAAAPARAASDVGLSMGAVDRDPHGA